MVPLILQWNCNGFYSRIDQVQYLMSKLDPYVMCIQETRFREDQQPKLKHWKIFHKNKLNSRIAAGGIAIFAKLDLFAEEITLNTNVFAVAMRMRYPKHLTICNIYIPNPPHDVIFDKSAFVDLVQQLPKPYIILGDFNAHSPIWGFQQKWRSC